uniref:Adrenomedullin 2b n=1 Tax=Esox lucius TaxID=8010 RepID=A0A3P9AJV5_ESOLU
MSLVAMTSLFRVWLCCLSLLSLETNTFAVPRPARTQPYRIILPRTPWTSESSSSFTMATAVSPSVALDDRVTLRNRQLYKGALRQTYRMLDHEGPLVKLSSSLPYQNYPIYREGPSRGRRHAKGSNGRGQGQLMRVGCVLGTCQVQNLSHRLYQLIGQSGRQDSSPINPSSPHSYG